MTLAVGDRLGSYEILGELGSGGMGQVYRARDSRLDGNVALKVLPPHLAGSADALARFEREAKAVAALSHPNILAIYDVGRERDQAFAVMELLEGETLRERLNGGATPARKAVEIAAQIAAGLAAAHERGIVHQGFETRERLRARRRAGEDPRLRTRQATRGRRGEFTVSSWAPPRWVPAHRGAEPGTVLGTVGYMAPEQVKGQTADARSDLFALGVILYELLTGRRAFARDSAVETMSAILQGGAAGDRPPGGKDSAGARSCPPPLPREGARRALSVGARPGVRPA